MGGTLTPLIATGVVVIAGRWAQHKSLDVKAAGAAAFLALAFTMIPDQIATPLAWLILLAALGVYGVPFTKTFGK